MKRELIILDFETNGFAGTSVLSISAIKALVIDNKIVEIDRYNRYYHLTPGEIENPHAIAINNLSKSNLNMLRKDITYPEFYIDDIQSFLEFCGDTDHFIAHNFSFDREFICFETAISFCTFFITLAYNFIVNVIGLDILWYTLLKHHSIRWYTMVMSRSSLTPTLSLLMREGSER